MERKSNGTDDMVKHPNHYRGKNGLEAWDVIEAFTSDLTGIEAFDIGNVLKYIWNDGSWMAVRPSGTEPKIKVYYSIKDKSKENAEVRLTKIKEKIHSIIQ